MTLADAVRPSFVLTIVLGAVLAGCARYSGNTPPPPPTAAPADDVELPTAEQADAAARREISSENADDEFERVQAEIEAEIGAEDG